VKCLRFILMQVYMFVLKCNPFSTMLSMGKRIPFLSCSATPDLRA